MYKKLYSRFIETNPNVLHFAAHSHHYWPDVTFKAHEQYWLDSCLLVDDKWSSIFAKQIPMVQEQIARILQITNYEQITFAPNTHELIYRVLSSLPVDQPLKILTTGSEFYSFDRQINRLAEDKNIQLKKISTEDLTSFEDRFLAALQTEKWDLVFLSHVFFNSSYVVQLEKILSYCQTHNLLTVVDDYHGFMALPTSWQKWQDDIFYIAGSYKYAQGGEGCCFMYAPLKWKLRPQYTGWFAELGLLDQYKDKVSYPESGLRYAGSTMDFSALYRLQAVLILYEKEKISVKKIHEHVQDLQKLFIEKTKNLSLLENSELIFTSWEKQGHFLTYEFKTEQEALEAKKKLRAEHIITDSRGSRLRFGFGLYQDQNDINELMNRMSHL